MKLLLCNYTLLNGTGWKEGTVGVNKEGGDEQGTGECHGLMCRWSERERRGAIVTKLKAGSRKNQSYSPDAWSRSGCGALRYSDEEQKDEDIIWLSWRHTFTVCRWTGGIGWHWVVGWMERGD